MCIILSLVLVDVYIRMEYNITNNVVQPTCTVNMTPLLLLDDAIFSKTNMKGIYSALISQRKMCVCVCVVGGWVGGEGGDRKWGIRESGR